MNGRMEHKIKNEKSIDVLLADLPEEVRQYYFSRSTSKESTGSLNYIYKIKKFLKFINEDTKSINVREITESDVTRFLHSIEQTTDHDGNIRETSFSYRKQNHSILNSFFEYLRKRRIIAENPMDCIERPSNKDIIKREKLDMLDIRFLLEGVEKGAGTKHMMHRQEAWMLRDKAIITLLALTGMRKTALTEINLEDIDFYNDTISVIDKRHKKHIYKMNEMMKQVLQDWIADREIKIQEHHTKTDTTAVFISSQRKRMVPASIDPIVKKYSLEILGRELSPHKLRAAFCTILYERTHDIEFVRRAVGHSYVETTQRYIVDDDSAREETASIMTKLFG